ncbi:MAG: GntR family transcriptional regulator [Propionibacteriaceae bacterium]|jgi:DNA-binding transcriptional regulator YhcF (GntR family)|nr:GntR family transcriptional regulator [Propionibacteriaceae bacterium]
MLLSIAPGSDVPIYLQLRHQIVDALVRGELREGDQLPSVRQLAVDLGINLHTVNKAYKVLEDEGYLSLQGRRGARVTAGPSYDDDYLGQLSETLGRLFTDAQSHGIDADLFRGIVDDTLSKGA